MFWLFFLASRIQVTTQAREGIETILQRTQQICSRVTTQAREGIETLSVNGGWDFARVTTQAREGIETLLMMFNSIDNSSNNSSPRGH